MDGSTRLHAADRKAALHAVRRGADPDLRLRAHILLLLDAGHPWAVVVAVLFTSTATINRWRRAYLRGGVDGVLVGTPGRRPRGGGWG